MDSVEDKKLINRIRRSERDSTVKNSKLLTEKLVERQEKKKLKVKISPQEGSSKDKEKNKEYSDNNRDLEVDLSTNSEDSQENIENPDNLKVLEDKINNLISAMEQLNTLSTKAGSVGKKEEESSEVSTSTVLVEDSTASIVAARISITTLVEVSSTTALVDNEYTTRKDLLVMSILPDKSCW